MGAEPEKAAPPADPRGLAEVRKKVASNQAYLAEATDFLEAAVAEWQQHGFVGRVLVELVFQQPGLVTKARLCPDRSL